MNENLLLSRPVSAPPSADEGETDYGIIRDPAAIEAGLVRAFRELFQMDDVGAEDDFFALGGDSLLAIALMSNVEREFTSVIPISVLIEAPTPKLLSKRILDDLNLVPPTNLVPVRTDGVGSPVFCIHGIDGDALFCRRLPPLLSPARPVYGLRATGLQDGEVPVVDVEAIASNYLAAIKGVQSTGPYLILGQCGSAVIALEMVHQLLSSGEQVGGLILVDPSASDFVPWLVSTGMRLSLLRARAAERARKVQEWAYSARGLSGDDRRKMVKDALGAAVGFYLPKTVDIEGLMLCSTPRGKRLLNLVRGYPTLINRLEVHRINGEHRELFMDFFKGREGKLKETGMHINNFLNRAAPVQQHNESR